MAVLQKKILLVGDFGVGKSSIMERFVHNRFSEEYHSTIGVVINKKELLVDNQPIKLLIWDIAGERNISEVPASYYLGCAGILYVFDLTRPETWLDIEGRLEKVRAMAKINNILIIANKSDCCSEDQIKQIIEKLNVPVDLITSAKNNENIGEAFETLARWIMRG